MGDLLWTCGNGGVFVSHEGSRHLVIHRASAGPGYRFDIYLSKSDRSAAIASGHELELRDAFEAAEAALRDLTTPPVTRSAA